MRRLVLLLLMFVLPLQTSWGAVHFCDDDSRVSHAIEAAAEPGDTDDPHAADPCCAAAHGCHSLHHLMDHAATALAAVDRGQVLAAAGASPPLGEIRTRIERPNWSAA